MLRLQASVPALGPFYPWLDARAAALGMNAILLARVHVVLEEVAANIAMHGYPAGIPGEISVRVDRDGDAFIAVVEDDGVAFNPTAARLPARPAQLSEAAIGGLGLGLIRGFCPDAQYLRCEGCNRLTLRFAASVRPPDAL
jgi:anti-sigma regulatory factor (Ser/Thr protein kinase)